MFLYSEAEQSQPKSGEHYKDKRKYATMKIKKEKSLEFGFIDRTLCLKEFIGDHVRAALRYVEREHGIQFYADPFFSGNNNTLHGSKSREKKTQF